MTEKEFVEILRKIQNRCEKIPCDHCTFVDGNFCQLAQITDCFNGNPALWKIDKADEIFSKEITE